MSCTSSCSAQHGWLLQGHAHCLGAGWGLAGFRMGCMVARVGPDGIRMGARGRLGLPPDSGGTVRPNTTRASKVPNNHKPTPSDFISIETFDLGHHTLSFLAAQQLYTYIWYRRTDGLSNSPFGSFREIDAVMHASGQISSNLLVFNLQLPHTTSNLLVYNLQLSYMFLQPVSVYLFEVMI